jgi:DNA-binding transcriptional LysR family regulator
MNLMNDTVDLNDVAIFTRVAQLESFSNAARVLGLPVSTVSRSVSKLEALLGVTLIARTTRKLSLTMQGRAYFNQCKDPLSELYEAERVLKKVQASPEGNLKISAPVVLSEMPFLDFISAFMKKYPRINVDLFITNQFHDLISENIDVGIRFGALEDSTLIAKYLGTTKRVLVASPEHLKGREKISSPNDLKSHDCVIMQGRNNETDWDLVSAKKKLRVHVRGKIMTRDFRTASEFVFKGHGVGLVPTFYCEEKIRAGTLSRVLPEWTSPKFDVHAVYPMRKFLPSKLEIFLEELGKWKSPLWDKRTDGQSR